MNSLIEKQRTFFNTGATLSLNFRRNQLCQLRQMVHHHTADIEQALFQDLGKTPQESWLTEIKFALDEIDFTLRHLQQWMKPKHVKTPLYLKPARSVIWRDPWGCVLIIAPWNYPFLIGLSPLIGAIAGGNCIILKPSEGASATQALWMKLIAQYFSPDYLCALKADERQTQALLTHRFDYVFFTGSTQVGQQVAASCAQHLTPMTLELGGKSPCIIDETASIAFAARRIVWAKFLNVGQTCIAPDFLYVHSSVKAALIDVIKQTLIEFYGTNPQLSPSYGRIINHKQFDRLISLMKNGKVIWGGGTDRYERYIAPTLIDEITWNDPIMQSEIFGPLLPILEFENLEEVWATLNAKPKPLALYYFSHDKNRIERVLKQLRFGGGCINDCLLQFANLHLPFGGVGQSGMGQYHGQYSFETFSHNKSIFRRSFPIDIKLSYPPYTLQKFKWLKRVLLIMK